MESQGAPGSAELFDDPGWTRTTATAVGDGPYPGYRPTGSWRLGSDGALRRVADIDLTERTLVIAYGSNANPNKLLGHPALFDNGDLIAMEATIVGWAAAWCNGRRTRDGVVVATLVPAPGRSEVHPLLALTERQLELIDGWEGHPTRYRRVRHDGVVLLETGRMAHRIDVYLGVAAARLPLLVDGRPLLLADVPYREVDPLVPKLDE